MSILLLTSALLASLSLGVLLHFKFDWFRRILHPWLVEHATLLGAYRSIFALVGFPVIILGGLLGFLDLRQRLSLPDLELHFRSGRDVAFTVRNPTDAIAPEPKYMLALWDFGIESKSLIPPSSLEIPVKVLGTMRPHSGLGSWKVSSLSERAARVANASRVFGFATVSCPKCARNRTYLLYFERNQRAWFTEVPDYEAPAVRAAIGRALDDPAILGSTIETYASSAERRPIE